MRIKKYSLMKLLKPAIKENDRFCRLYRELDVRNKTIGIDLATPGLRKIYENLKLYKKLDKLQANEIDPFVIKRRKSKMTFETFGGVVDPFSCLNGDSGIEITWYKKHNRKITIYIVTDKI